jgi:glutaredoxin
MYQKVLRYAEQSAAQFAIAWLKRNSIMLACGTEAVLKMITRRLLSKSCLILLLVPTPGWTLNESGDLPAAQSASGEAAPAQAEPPHIAPAKPASAPAASTKPLPAPAVAVKPAPAPTPPAIPAPAPVAPVKPVPVLVAPAKPAPVPASAAQPALTQTIPRNPLPAKQAPVQAAPIPPVQESTADFISETIDIEVFIREDCPQCDKAKEFLARLQKLKPQLNIVSRNVRKEPAALELLKRVAKNQGETALDYPAFVVGGQLIIGFSEDSSTAQLILDTLASSRALSQQTNKETQDCESENDASCGLIAPTPVTKPEIATLKLFGYSVPVVQIGLPLFTVAMGLLDGLNHGSTWVLVLMISLLSPLKNRPHMLAIAGTFIAVQGIVYFILMAAWLNLSMLIDISRSSQIAIAAIALLAAAIYFKKYTALGKINSLSSNEIAKPGIYTRIRKIMQTENLAAAMLGTAVLAVLVQLGEFSYTSVFPALYTRTLTLHQLGSLSNYGYLLLYDLAYMLDDAILLTAGIVTLSQSRPQEKNGRVLKLISGLALLGLGVYLLLSRY